MTTASELILSSLHGRPMTARDLIGLLVQKGYEQDVAGAITDAWLQIFCQRGQVDCRTCDGVGVYSAVADYEQEKEPEVKKNANAVWREAIAKAAKGKGS